MNPRPGSADRVALLCILPSVTREFRRLDQRSSDVNQSDTLLCKLK